MPHEQRYNDFWAFLGKGTCSCKYRRSLHCERWAVDSPCSQLRHWSESPSASPTVVRRAGCRGPCIYLSVDKYDAVRPQPPTRRWLAPASPGARSALEWAPYLSWSGPLSRPALGCLPALDACRWAALLERPTSPMPRASRFFILAPSGPCERQLRYVKRPLPANQPHTPATGRAPPSQQACPPRFPTSSPNGTHVRAQSRARRAPNRGVAP